MSLRTQILAFEARAKRLKISVRQLCAETNTPRTSWWRWRQDDNPTDFERIDEFLTKLEGNK